MTLGAKLCPLLVSDFAMWDLYCQQLFIDLSQLLVDKTEHDQQENDQQDYEYPFSCVHHTYLNDNNRLTVSPLSPENCLFPK